MQVGLRSTALKAAQTQTVPGRCLCNGTVGGPGASPALSWPLPRVPGELGTPWWHQWQSVLQGWCCRGLQECWMWDVTGKMVLFRVLGEEGDGMTQGWREVWW